MERSQGRDEKAMQKNIKSGFLTLAVTCGFLFQAAAEILRPMERLTPNEWAEKNRILPEGKSPHPGPWHSEAWQGQIMDAFLDRNYKGIILMKAGQIGGSELAINLIGYIFSQIPCPVLFLCSTDTIAKEFSLDRFGYMIESCKDLQSHFLLGRKHHESIDIKRAISGKLVIWGSQSPNKLMSEPFRIVFLDEFDRLPTFPGIGDAYKLATVRISAFGQYGKIIGYSTPTEKDKGIAHVYENDSTMEKFHVPCPRCGTMQALEWKWVVIPENNPKNAHYVCAKCGYQMSDHERYAAVKKGKYISEIPEGDRAKVSYRGFHIGQQYQRDTRLEDMAKNFLSSKSEADIKVFYNSRLGLPYTSNLEPITISELREKIGDAGMDNVPEDTLFITAGGDVQKDIHNPVFYLDISAWDKWGTKHLISIRKIVGYEALRFFLQSKRFKDGRGKDWEIALTVIDSQFGTLQVYKFCKDKGNKAIPIRHAGREFITKKKLYGGNLTLWIIHEQQWLDRVIGRYQVETGEGGGVTLPKDIPDEYFNHFKGMRLIEKTNNDGKTNMLWQKEGRYSRVDWVYSAVYAEVAAHLLNLEGLVEIKPEVKAKMRTELPRGTRLGVRQKQRRWGRIRTG